jgi:autotransporter-associated beta strand protein
MSGAVVTERLVSGLLHPTDIALSGSDLFVMNNYGSTIGEYTTSGSTVNASLIPNVGNYGLALSGSDLFVGNYQAGTIGEYTTPGATVNASLISGLNDPDGIAVVVPSKLTWNNAGGSGDGLSWDTVQQNWNDGTDAVFYSDGDSVTFNDANNSMSSGGSNPNAYNVTLNTTVAPASIVVNNCLGNYSISGNGTIGGTSSLTKSGTGTLTLSTANTYSGGTIVCGGLLVIEPTRSTTSALPNGALTISGSGNIQLANNVTAGSPPATSNVNITSLSISGNGTLDIGNNRIIIDYSSDATDPIASIAAWISSGYAAGTWAGAGITSSAAAFNSGSYSIGYADGADPGNPAGLYRGQIEIMYTLLGDANLDGKVNGTDFNLMATNFNQAVTTGWDKGDFNYDGKVNGNDFVLLADNFNQSAVSAADLAALDAFAVANGISLANAPEPACAGMMVMAGLGIVRRRRRLLRSVPRFRALLSGVAPHLDT